MTLFVVATTFVWERPYHVMPPSWEQDYFYSGRLILEELRPDSVWHPGTPVQYLTALLLLFTGTSAEGAQTFFNVSYLVAGLALITSAAIFARLVLARASFVVALATLALVALWPPTLAFLGIWHAETFAMPVALLLWGVLWRTLDQPHPSMKLLRWVGVLAGLAMAVKGTFLVLVVIALGSVALHLLAPADFPRRKKLWRALVAPLAAGATFLVLTAPVLPRLYVFIERIVLTWKANPRGAFDYLGGMADLAQAAPGFALVVAGLVALLITSVASQARHAGGVRLALVHFDRHLALLAVGAGLAVAAAMSPSVGPGDGGVAFVEGINQRQLTPVASAAVLVPLLVARTQMGQALAQRAGAIGAALASLALVLLVAWTLVTYVDEREELVAREQAASSALRAALIGTGVIEEGVDGERVALATWGQGRFGAPEFHLSGSDLFTGGDFTPEVIRDYPGFTLLYLRVAAEIAGYQPPDPSSVGLLKGPLQDLWESWKEAFPGKPLTGELFSGEHSGELISHVVYVADDLPQYTSDMERDLRVALQRAYGIASERQFEAGGDTWTLLELAVPPGRAN
jgi:hypothetical protein